MTSTESAGWAVLKFGGTSVSSAQGWNTVAAEMARQQAAGRQVLVVVSALSQVTNDLAALAEASDEAKLEAGMAVIRQRHDRLARELGVVGDAGFEMAFSELLTVRDARSNAPDAAWTAQWLSQGERLSSRLGVAFLQQQGLDVQWHDATDLLHTTGDEVDTPMTATVDARRDPDLANRLSARGALHLTQGFVAAGPDGQPWLLGRGGSDTSAACLAARLDAHLELWTDVPGMFSADPRVVPQARLLRHLSYSEAQELASMGARVLHPPSVRLAREAGVPLSIRDTHRPELDGTEIGPRSGHTEAQVKGIVSRSNVTIVVMDNPSMWRQVGFLADAFGVFRRHGLSVDLISTSESSVTVTLDPARPGSGHGKALDALVSDLGALCHVSVRTGCVSISLVGNAIRTILGQLSEALDLFHDRKIHLVTQSANDLNLTLVVDPEQSEQLVQQLHRQLIPVSPATGPVFGPTWDELTRSVLTDSTPPWWRDAAPGLLQLLEGSDCAYVYHPDTARAAARRLLALDAIDRVLYATKANHHPALLSALDQEGVGFECVSYQEVQYLQETLPELDLGGVLFTPNFAGREEYAAGLEAGVQLTLDNPFPLVEWPELFAGRDVFLRLDLDIGHGHHRKVITSGARSKFGIALAELDGLQTQLHHHGIRVTGLHVHTGSGVQDHGVWAEQFSALARLRERFPDVEVFDLGGGLGVPDRAGQPALDLQAVNDRLMKARQGLDVSVWIEPGRYLSAQCGVLLARVNQVKRKGDLHYLGVATGMNSLIRPALYGAWHDIVNLSRLGEPESRCYTVVGPICETGDVLGDSRFLANSQAGDVLLIANAGAYGRVMSSHYNLRAPAQELVYGE